MTSDHTQRFSGRVREYVQFRQKYPVEILGFIREVCGIEPDWRVADIGAGTGMLAELFLEYGCSVDAIEPNDEMRAACEEMMESYPKLRVSKGTAEKTGLDLGAVDLLCAGRAFHWFDPVESVREFNRVLRPGGWIVLVASGPFRDRSEVGQAYERLLIEHTADYDRVRDRCERGDEIAEFFVGGELHAREFSAPWHLTLEQLAGLTRSYSSAPLAGSAGDAAITLALKRFFAEWQRDGYVVLQPSNVVSVGRLAAWIGDGLR